MFSIWEGADSSPIYNTPYAEPKNFLEPLAIASNITQADGARVDIVLIMFAFFIILYIRS
jgi:hypothetical protein